MHRAVIFLKNNNQPIEVVQGCWTKLIQKPLLLVSAGVELPSKLSVWTVTVKGFKKLETGTDGDPAEVVTELKTMPQILSTQIDGVPDWTLVLLFVAQGMVSQSVEQAVLTLLPSAGDPPV